MLDKKTAALFKDLEPLEEEDVLAETECDLQTQDDMNAIAHMLEASEKEGLQCEVVYQLIQGKVTNIPRECMDALYEWDI